MKRIMIVALAICTLAITAISQGPERKPGAEQERIKYFAGQWNFEGEVKPSPMGPGGKVSGKETCEWFAGGFHLVCRSDVKSPMGAMKAQSIMGYDPNEKTYTFYAINSGGEGFLARGNPTGKVWNWSTESKVNEKPMKVRATITEESPASYTIKVEASVDGGDWVVLEEAKATKVK